MGIIEFQHAGYSYDGVARALSGISLVIEDGSFTCVLGVNGSGKSTLARLADGLLRPTEGRVLAAGMDTADDAAARAVRSAVGLVFQNPDDQIVASIVEDEVAFGPENLGVAPSEIRERVTGALGAVGLAGFEKRPVDELSGGEKQRLAVAGALAMKPGALVLDEVTAMLDPAGRDELIGLCRALNGAGTTIVLITQFMEEAAQADRVIVLDSGEVALDGPAADVLAQEARLAELGLLAPLAEQAVRPPAPPRRLDGQAAAVEFDNVCFTYGNAARPALSDVAFSLPAGASLGISGRTGSGKSTLVQLTNGLLRPSAGSVRILGQDNARMRANALNHQVSVAFQYPEHQLFAATAYDDVAFGPRNLGLGEDEVSQRVQEALEMVGLDFEDVRERSPFALSGGEQRRVALAGVLAMNAPILVLDEPTAGLDPRGRRSLVDLLKRLRAERTMTLVVASHDMECLYALSDYLLEL